MPDKYGVLTQQEVKERTAEIYAEVEREAEIDELVKKLDEVKGQGLSEREYLMKESFYRDLEQRAGSNNPRESEINSFRQRHADHSKQVQDLKDQLDSMGYEEERRIPAPPMPGNPRICAESVRNAWIESNR